MSNYSYVSDINVGSMANGPTNSIVTNKNIIASVFDADNNGGVYVYDLNKVLKYTLSPVDEDLSHYGEHMACDGDTLLVGIPGKVYVYDITDGSLLSVIHGSDLSVTDDSFGTSVAVYGDKIVIGCPNNNSNGNAYITDVSGNLLKTLSPDENGITSLFGCSVDIYGDNIVIGASHDSLVSSNVGAAYLYNISTDTIIRLDSGDAATEYQMGLTVSINDANIIIGGYGDNNDGYVLYYDINGNYISYMVNPETDAAYGEFGTRIDSVAGYVIIGSADRVVYVYDKDMVLIDTITSVNQVTNNTIPDYDTSIVDGETKEGIGLTDPSATITVSFDKVTYDPSIPSEVQFVDVNGATIKLDISSEYIGNSFTATIGNNVYSGVFEVNEDYNNPTVISLINSEGGGNPVKSISINGYIINIGRGDMSVVEVYEREVIPEVVIPEVVVDNGPNLGVIIAGGGSRTYRI